MMDISSKVVSLDFSALHLRSIAQVCLDAGCDRALLILPARKQKSKLVPASDEARSQIRLWFKPFLIRTYQVTGWPGIAQAQPAIAAVFKFNSAFITQLLTTSHTLDGLQQRGLEDLSLYRFRGQIPTFFCITHEAAAWISKDLVGELSVSPTAHRYASAVAHEDENFCHKSTASSE